MKRLYSPLLALLLTLSTFLPSYAGEFIDPTAQYPSTPGSPTPSWPEHWVFYDLYLDAMFSQNNRFTWNATSLYNYANTAIARWNAELPVGVDAAQYTNDSNAAHVRFVEQVCPTPSFPACTVIDQWMSVGGLNVNLWSKLRIFMQPNGTYMPGFSSPFSWTGPGRNGALTHEVGHAWGLGEQYNSNGTCNNSSYAIMDGLVSVLTEGAYYLSPCDTEYVTANDKTRLHYYFLGGGYDFVQYINAPGYLASQWKDASWMDWTERFYLYSGPSASGPWTVAFYDPLTYDNGSHRFVFDAMNRTLQSTYMQAPGQRYYLACSLPVFNDLGSVGEWRCTSIAVWRS